jgi:hypothetical protein
MNNITRLKPFDELVRFEHLLTRIDPSLNIDVFNRFMLRPVVPEEIGLQSKMNLMKADGQYLVNVKNSRCEQG